MLASRWAIRLAILPLVKFLSRLFTALNLEPSIATHSPVIHPARPLPR